MIRSAQHVRLPRLGLSRPVTSASLYAHGRHISQNTARDLDGQNLYRSWLGATTSPMQVASPLKLSSATPLRFPSSFTTRQLSTSAYRLNQSQPVKKDANQHTPEAEVKAEEQVHSQERREAKDRREEFKDETKEKKEKKEKKEEQAPPPPHGDKTPYQVFVETMRSEFKASKEWNESTKALASSAHQFTESENIKKVRTAYSSASGAASSKTASALKSTGQVIGNSVAWTWDTPVLKGVRAGASAAGRGLDKATKPVRETPAFKSIKETIDDGSSSRYGGWIEKEERRKARERRQLNESRDGKGPAEKMEEDPKYLILFRGYGALMANGL